MFVSLVSWLLTSVCLHWCTLQAQVSGVSTNTVLRNLQPDTEYRVTVVPVYPDAEGKKQSENGKTSVYLQCKLWIILCVSMQLTSFKLSQFPEPLGGVKNLQVTDPTTSSLKVRWEPAEGNVRQYRIFYVPASGGAEDMVKDANLYCLLDMMLTDLL